MYKLLYWWNDIKLLSVNLFTWQSSQFFGYKIEQVNSVQLWRDFDERFCPGNDFLGDMLRLVRFIWDSALKVITLCAVIWIPLPFRHDSDLWVCDRSPISFNLRGIFKLEQVLSSQFVCRLTRRWCEPICSLEHISRKCGTPWLSNNR